MSKKDKSELEDLFGDALPLDGLADDVYTIDTDLIANESNVMASTMISTVLRLYNNKEFVDEHPDFRKRIDTEIESLKRTYKMIKTNEVVHDHLVQSITKNPDNASLYMALTKLQEKIIQLDGDIKKIIDGLNKICSNFQMELNFEATRKDSENETSRDETGIATRGNKQFVDMMKADEDDDQLDLFGEETQENLSELYVIPDNERNY